MMRSVGASSPLIGRRELLPDSQPVADGTGIPFPGNFRGENRRHVTPLIKRSENRLYYRQARAGRRASLRHPAVDDQNLTI